jgi:hypothetical protein
MLNVAAGGNRELALNLRQVAGTRGSCSCEYPDMVGLTGTPTMSTIGAGSAILVRP